MNIKNFKRKIISNLRTVGRNFLRGDIVIYQDNELLHFYINDNKDGIDVLKNDNAIYISPENIEKLLDNSEDI